MSNKGVSLKFDLKYHNNDTDIRPCFACSLNGVPLDCMLDTGANIMLFYDTKLFECICGSDYKFVGFKEISGVTGVLKARHYIINNLNLSDTYGNIITYTNAPAVVLCKNTLVPCLIGVSFVADMDLIMNIRSRSLKLIASSNEIALKVSKGFSAYSL